MDSEGLPHWLGRLDNAIGSLSRIGLLGLHKYLPYRKWFRRELTPYIRDVLSDHQTHRIPYWNHKSFSSIIADHESGLKNYTHEINAVLTLEAVDRLLVRANAYSAAIPTTG
jgi:asparagine synthase (glutamine-hydrolysing)